MKINPKYNKRVNKAVDECRKSLIAATIDLLKMIAQDGQDVYFGDTLVFFEDSGDGIRPIVFSMIAYCTNKDEEQSFFVLSGEGFNRSSTFMSVDNLHKVYKKVYALIRNY